MRIVTMLAALVIAAAAHAQTPDSTALGGRFYVDRDTIDRVIITRLDDGALRVESPGAWQGAGVLEGRTYWGVFRYPENARDASSAGARGTHLGTLGLDGRLRVEGSFTNRAWPRFWSVWSPQGSELPEILGALPGGATPGRRAVVSVPEAGAAEERLPRIDEHRHVDEQPKSLVEEVPVYPREARDKGIQGTVVVLTLVDSRGFVRETRIKRSVPALDSAAVQAVRSWRFRPALDKGKPVPCWIAIPVKFRLH